MIASVNLEIAMISVSNALVGDIISLDFIGWKIRLIKYIIILSHDHHQ